MKYQQFNVHIPITDEQAAKAMEALKALAFHKGLRLNDRYDREAFLKRARSKMSEETQEHAWAMFQEMCNHAREDEDLSLEGLAFGHQPAGQIEGAPDEARLSFWPKYVIPRERDKEVQLGVLAGIIQTCQRRFGGEATGFVFYREEHDRMQAYGVFVTANAVTYTSAEEWVDARMSEYRHDKQAEQAIEEAPAP